MCICIHQCIINMSAPYHTPYRYGGRRVCYFMCVVLSRAVNHTRCRCSGNPGILVGLRAGEAVHHVPGTGPKLPVGQESFATQLSASSER